MDESKIELRQPELQHNRITAAADASVSPACPKPTVVSCTYLHKDDPMNLFQYMSNGSVNRCIKGIRILTGKSLYDMTIEEWFKFRKEQWFKCPKIGQKSIDEFDGALQTFGLSV